MKTKVALAAAVAGLTSTVSSLDSRKALFYEKLQEIDFAAVEADITALLTDSQDFFPADYGNYGPFFIRMTWHCAGTYRLSDGEGSCDGGRQRFDPERSWDDNTNLDKARRLLEPIKEKYGTGLSWGDLIVLAGTTSIKAMGGPVLGNCLGRFDDLDGSNSIVLGPSDLQEVVSPCDEEQNGECQAPMGANTIELIYVNPGGVKGVPEPDNTVPAIREVFGRMGFNDSESVSLIGGGHAFGKTHGACPDGAGDKPKDNPENSWAGNCGTGIGADTFTSGFEGPWTQVPDQWTNLYFSNLLNLEDSWTLETGPGGANQFTAGEGGPTAPAAHGEGTQDIMMLVSDIAFLRDPTYRALVETYADDISVLENDFAHSWYKLMTRDMGPISRCFGPDVPEAQDFQSPLPPPLDTVPDLRDVVTAVADDLSAPQTAFASDTVGNAAYNGAWFVETAFLCAQTFRDTDHNGGCNGARIALSPESAWVDRLPVAEVVNNMRSFGGDQGLSLADSIVFSATVALQEAASRKVEFSFCPGRSDATDAPNSEFLKLFEFEDKALEQKRQARLFDFSPLEYVAIQGRPRSVEYMKSLGYQGSYTTDVNVLSNTFAQTLLSETWTIVAGTEDLPYGSEYVNADGDKFITRRDFVLISDAEFEAALFELAADEQFFLETFAATWTKLMNADRFDGPVENQCENGNVDIFAIGDVVGSGPGSPATFKQVSSAALGMAVGAALL